MAVPTIVSTFGSNTSILSNPTSSHTFNYPLVTGGDRLVLIAGTNIPNVISLNLSGGWRQRYSYSASNMSFFVFDVDDTGQTGSFTGTSRDDGAALVSCIITYCIIRVSGDIAPPYDFATVVDVSASGPAQVNTPNVDFSGANHDALVLSCWTADDVTNFITTPPTGYTTEENAFSPETIGHESGTLVASKDVTNGTSEDPGTWSTTNTRHVGITIAIRGPSAKTQVASDDFNRANGNLTTPWSQLNAIWGNVEIVSNEIDATAAASGDQRAAARYDDVFANDQYSELEIRALAFQSINESIGVIVRAGTNTTTFRDYYFANVYLNTAGPSYTTVFGKVVSGVYSEFNTELVDWAVGDVLGLEAKGTEIRVTKNGDHLGGDFLQIDTSHASGDAGVTMAGSAGKADNWVAGDLSAGAVADVDLSAYRWSEDDNAAHESTTFAAAEDTALDVDVATELGIGFNLVVKLGNEGAVSEDDDFQLQYNKNGGGWNNIGSVSSNVRSFDGQDSDQATSATERLSATPETHQGSVYNDNGGLQPGVITTNIADGNSYEFYYCVEFRSGENTAGDSYQFRILAGAEAITQDVIPSASITSAAVADVDLSHYRWSDDDNAAHESTTFLAAEDTALDVDVVTDLGVGFNLVVKLGNEGGATETDNFQLQYNKNAGGWNNVDATSVPVRMFNGQDTDGATSATERLTTTPETHQGSVYEEVDGLITTDIPNGQSFEFYFCIEFVTGQNVNGDSYQFRILEGVTPITQDVIPTVNIISSAVANVDLAHYRWADDDNVAHELASFLAVEDTSYEVLQSERGTGLHLVVKLHNDGSAAETDDFQLQYNKNGGGWADVNAASSNVRSFNGQDTDGATSATERLTTLPETHIGSVYDEVDGLITTNIAVNNSYEFYFCIEFRAADNLGGESYEFRILAGAAPITQDVIPTATVESLVELGGINLVNSEFDPAKVRRLTV